MISNNLKKIRNKRGMSISELARRTNLSRMTISDIENLRVIPNLKSAIFISRELGLNIDSIFFEVDVNHDLRNEEVINQ